MMRALLLPVLLGAMSCSSLQAPASWISGLGHPDRARRMDAQARLVATGDKTLFTDLEQVVYESPNPLARERALHAMAGLGVLDIETTINAFQDPDERVRAAAVSAAGSLFQARGSFAELKAVLEDPSPLVARAAIQVLLRFQSPEAASWIGQFNQRLK